jgi:DHA1 family multidrug resistance protein-like MFS transporter
MRSFPWQKNLVIISIAAFLAMSGFFMVNPFTPLYLQQLGHLSSDQAAFWSGIVIGGASLAMFVSAPLWGLISDRFGRKLMFLRSLFGGAVVVGLYTFTINIYAFIVLRICQGLFTGIVATAAALVVNVTPRDKVPFAMGVLMGTIYAATSVGPLMGGFLADHFGFTTAFIVTILLLVTAGTLVLFFTREDFKAPAKADRASLKSTLRLAVTPAMLPLLLVIVFMNMGTTMISPIVTLRINEINPLGDVASAAGLAFALAGGLASLSSFFIGRLDKKMSLKSILFWSTFITGLLYLFPIWANTVTWMVITVGLTGLVVGGSLISSNSLITFTVPATLHGVAFGLSQSGSALGRGLGPIIGGGLVPFIGLRPVFGVAAGAFILAALLNLLLLSKNKVDS